MISILNEFLLNKLGFILTRTRNVSPEKRMNVAIVRELTSIDLFVDIGANEGQTYRRIRSLSYTGRYLAIEPEVACFNKLSKIEINDGNFHALQCAVGSKADRVHLNVASNAASSSSILDLGNAHSQAAPDIKMIEIQSVNQLPLSHILRDYTANSAFVKIDVQGYELEVLKGMDVNVCNRVQALLIECNLVETYKDCSLIEEVFSLLRTRGFKPFRIENGFGTPNFGQQLQVDVLFTRASKP